MNYFYLHEEKQHGPVSIDRLKQLQTDGILKEGTIIWEQGNSAITRWPHLQPQAVAEEQSSITLRCIRCSQAFYISQLLSSAEGWICSNCSSKTTPKISSVPGLERASAMDANPPTITRIPLLSAEGPTIDPGRFVEPGTGWRIALGSVVAAAAFILGTLGTGGILLVALPIAWIFDWLLQRRTRAKIHGSSIQVSARQFPEIHQCIAEYSRRLGLSDPPRTYVVESNETNAFALRSFGRRLVLLNDDIIFACLRTNPHALKFIIAHELAHHALHHTHLFRSYVRQCVPSLSRLDEFSADRVAAALVNDERSCADALTVLLSGPQLFGLLNRAALAQQAAEVAGTKLSLKAEKRLSHPLLLRRLARFSTALS